MSRLASTLLCSLCVCLISLKAVASEAPPSTEKEFLEAHNILRLSLHLEPFVWSAEMAQAAQKWAEFLLENRLCRHRPNLLFGENLFLIDGRLIRPGEVVEQWASESTDFHDRLNACGSVCGHYTQMVWRATKKIGCGVAASGTRQVWVCNYDPPGNIAGQRPY